MKLSIKLLSALMLLLMALPTRADETQDPIITFKTTLYESAGASNAFHFYIGAKTNTYIDIDFGFGLTEVEVEQAVFDSSTSGIKATTVSGSVGDEGIVKIYGDASLIDYLDLEGVYITQLDISALTELEILNVSHNELEALDLSPFSKLQAIYLSDNPFSKSPVIIGGNKPALTILDMSMVGKIDQNFNMSDYPALLSFDAYATHDLRQLDPSGCPGLLRLSAENTGIMTIDVSNNPELLILSVSETGVNKLDVSHNTKLTELYCAHDGSWMSEYKISTLDVSNNPRLIRLLCNGNNLTTLDVSHNPELTSLLCNNNRLTTIDISNNPYIQTLNISNNYMDFTTLPEPRETFVEYYYYQKPLPVERSYPVNAEIDMSDKVMRPDTQTWFTLFARQRDEEGLRYEVELPEDYYTFDNGKVTLLKSSPDSICMAFANSLFPEYDIRSSYFMVKETADYGKDNPAVRLRTRPGVSQVQFSIGIQGATPESPKEFSIDFGDGTPVKFTTTTHLLPESPNASGAVKRTGSMVIYLPEGTDMSALGINGVSLLNISIDAAPCLTDLSLTDCSLTAIDLQWNRLLVNLDLSGNNLSELNLRGGDNANEKNMLRSLKASNNNLESFLPGFGSIQYVDISNNKFTAIDLSKASKMTYLDISNNFLTDVDVKDLEAIETLNLSGNNLGSIVLPDYLPLQYFDISSNRFSLSQLPVTDYEQYIYAPQKNWEMPAKAPVANLTSQLRDIDGQTTRFDWYKADGTPVPSASITQNTPGIFQLLDVSLGKIYCSFTHEAFPALSGADSYRTTDIEVAEMPNVVIGTFHTLESGIGDLTMTSKNDNSAIYIDWSGNGALEQYTLKKELQSFDINVTENTDVTIYAYSENADIDVFSLGAGPMSRFDGSKLKNLTHFSLIGAQLDIDKLQLPDAPLTELSLAGNALTSTPFIAGYPDLVMLNLSNNQLTTTDVTSLINLKVLYIAYNELTDIKLDNPLLWELALNNNNLETLDLSKLPSIEQLFLSDNYLHTLDISHNNALRILYINHNNFDFTTLPDIRSDFKIYRYNDQRPIEAVVTDAHMVDLSGYGAETFKWYIDSPYYDESTGELYGEELEEGTEYTLADGVTTFLKNFTHIMCVMQNRDFPDLDLYTDFIDVRVDSAVDGICADKENETVIYDLQGRLVRNPAPGLYIVNGRKVLIK